MSLAISDDLRKNETKFNDNDRNIVRVKGRPAAR